ncbi:hypothetical protein [Desulfovibrio ferrophilus]|uniref:Uncharacterized protein n=1 Tax=Desulfovibrio ferrophilus TaxID=241368 RepID=A0A2Z6B1Z7_9BACT|nr:hypothetical protein [Desulfovibrio ferrophilus]BBD09468.1 uncharacterized protein DFE_2742 [Desulfovibrio ferrophilus]
MSKKKHNKSESEERLVLTLRPDDAGGFARAWALALHDGFLLRVPGAMSVMDLLTEFVGLDASYVDDRIRAIFLDGHPVDDLDAAPVGNGNELSLSSAMPGVAGITMGRNNAIAVYREGITFQCDGDCDERAGLIRVRLFNFIARETAPQFMALGVGLDGRGWQRVVHDAPAEFWSCVVQAKLDGVAVSTDVLSTLPPPEEGCVRFLQIINGGK